MFRRVLIERLPRKPLYQRPKNNKVDVAINECRSWGRCRCRFERHAVSSIFAFPMFHQIHVRSQPGVVNQQLADCDVLFSVLPELGTYFATGSFMRNFPCSQSCRIAVVVATTLVSEAQSNTVSIVIASRFGSIARLPYALR